MSKALIITAYLNGTCKELLKKIKYDIVICADGGLLIAEKLNIKADVLIGDYDSMKMPENRKTIKLPCEKDMTDSEAAIDLAVSMGYKDIIVLGGLGGRFDHTMGNIGILSKYVGKNINIAFSDDQNYVFMLGPGEYRIPSNMYKYTGLISHSDKTTGLTLTGFKYPLDNFILTNDTSLGVSNEIINKEASISFKTGKLLVILSNDSQGLK